VYSLGRAARSIAVRGCAALCLSAVFLLAGCGNFFLCEGKPSCPSSGGGGGSTTSDWVYISNASAGSSNVSEYDIGNGSLAAITGSPFNMNFVPVAMSVSPNNAFLYAATQTTANNPGIYLFSINSTTGALSVANGGNVLISSLVSSMDISPDGNFLFVIDALGTSLTEYQIASGTGLLSLAATLAIPPTTCVAVGSPVVQSCSVKVAPSGQFVVAALGTAGDIIYPYSSASGITNTSGTTISSGSSTNNPTGDYSVALDKNNFAYIARTAALAVYSLDASGNPTLKSTQTFDAGNVARSVALSASYSYVYTANIGTSNISGYGINTTGSLAAISGSPFPGPTNVSAIGADKSGKYMVAAGYDGSSGVQLFSIGTTGALTLVTSAGSGTSLNSPAILALSH
jgi:6-phosphogluconolactonase (cycloisomerase 2 family)